MCKLLLNEELNGIEMYFEGKPERTVLNDIKSVGFRWNKNKFCWYAKQSEKTISKAQEYGEMDTDTTISNVVKTVKKVAKKDTKTSLWDRVQFIEGNENTSEYDYKFVGSNYTGLSTKETAKIIRTHLRKRFKEVKFSVTSDYNEINITIKQSPYNNKKLEYSAELECSDYRKYEKEHNKELLAIKNYCEKLLNSYNYDDSDSMSDYFCTHFYSNVTIDYDYTQTEQNEEVKEDIENFRTKLVEEEKADEERKEQEYQKYLAEQEESNKRYQLRQEQEKKEIEIINNNIEVVEIEADKQYFVLDSQFANLNKNNTLDEYKQEVAKNDYKLQNVKITKEVHFQNAESLKYFSNLLLTDFDFLTETGGTYTDDERVNSMEDYYQMTIAEQNTVEWNLKGVAIYFNNELQFVIDAQGYSYARYVGLVDNITIQKNYTMEQTINNKTIEKLQNEVDTLTDISTTVITENNLIKTWNNEDFEQYKKLMIQKLKDFKIKLNKNIIQQIPESLIDFKIVMYKILKEVDGIQDQFKNANINQGDKLTLFYISDFGGIVTDRITFDSVEYTSYAQHENAIKLTYTPQGKRKQYYNYFYSTLLVYNGWLELPKTVLNTIETKNGMTITSSKYGSCDHEQYDEILEYFKKQNIKPIINTYKRDFE